MTFILTLKKPIIHVLSEVMKKTSGKNKTKRRNNNVLFPGF